MKSAYFASARPRFLGHRGSAGHAPENTLLSFEIAAQHVKYLETDTWITRDGVPVFLHDESLLRTCGVDKKISDLTWEEVQAFDAAETFTLDGGKTFPYRGQGHGIPSVESILKKFPGAFFNIELKDSRPEASTKLLQTLSRCEATERVLLAAEHDVIMQRLRSEKPSHVPTSAAYGEVYAFLIWFLKGAPEGAYKTEASAFQIPHQWQTHNLSSPAMIEKLHTMNIEVHYWTINEKPLIRKLLDAGADGIVTDLPELAADFAL
ncbi:MAG: glycerophosphodiester phosphodiesterase [Bdellovibrionota bacterium]